MNFIRITTTPIITVKRDGLNKAALKVIKERVIANEISANTAETAINRNHQAQAREPGTHPERPR